jgi:hypothetical protein
MATRPVSLPPGFVLEQQQQQPSAPNLPPGFVLEGQQPAAVPVGQITAGSHPSTLGGKIEDAWSRVSGDIKYGTAQTPVGSVLQFLGAQPTQNGTSEGVSDMMASPMLGTAKASEGVGQLMQHGKRLKGAGNVVKGTLQATQLPTSFVAPEAADAAPAVANEVGALAQKVPIVGRVFASADRAGQNFQRVNQAAGKVPLEVTPELSDAALSVYRESELGGGNIPQVVRKFVARITSPDKGPLTFEDARRFASNASGMTAGEWFNMLKNGNMRRLLGEFHGELNQAVQQAADKAGVGEQFAQAMNEYRQAKQNQSAVKAFLGASIAGGALYKGKKYLSNAVSGLLE